MDTVDAAKTVTAQFDLIPVVTYALNITKAGTGTGTVTSAPPGINCGADCAENYAENTVQPIPTLSEWALILRSLMTASLGLVAYRRRM